MRAVFSLASKLSPCVLFIDEVDAMLAKRDSQREHEAHRELKNEFMAQWDGIRTGSSSSIDRVRAPLSHVQCACILSWQLAPVGVYKRLHSCASRCEVESALSKHSQPICWSAMYDTACMQRT